MVKNFIKNGTNLIISKQNSILSAATILMAMILASRLLGLVRDRLLAGEAFVVFRFRRRARRDEITLTRRLRALAFQRQLHLNRIKLV
jgi:hypothetical protein